MDRESPRRLLLTGIPGTGKTEAGHALAALHGFMHFDAELHASAGVSSLEAWVELWEQFLRQVRHAIEAGDDLVVTWGFMPGVDNITIRALQGMGLRMIWFDGDRAVARRVFLSRGTVLDAALKIQMGRIEGLDLASFAPVPFDPFQSDGTFLSREEIAHRLIELASVPAPM